MGKNDIDVVGILKWASEHRKEIDAERPKRRGYRRYREQPSQMEKLFNDFLEDQLRNKFREMDDKLNKKDEKKEEKKGWDALSFVQRLAVLTAVVPPAMMGLIIMCLLFAKTVSHLM